jgi:hypothetical protein
MKMGIMAWYPGQVIAVSTLRSESIIKDEAIPTLLLRVVRPTFVTINVRDFWKKALPHTGYCIINIAVPKERAPEIPDILRRLFRLSDFKAKASRLGKIIRLTQDRIEYYERDRRIHFLLWPD